MAKEGNFGFIQGQDMTIRVNMRKNVSGWALACAVASAYKQTPLFTKTTASGITIIDGPDGPNSIAAVTINDTDTDTLDAGTTKDGKDYVWDIKRTDADQEAVLTWGTLTLKPKVVP